MNEEKVPEIKTAETEQKKEKEIKVKEKAPKKAKEPKKPKEPMDKQDQLCYFGALVFLILAFLPVIMRNMDPGYDPDKFKVKEETQNKSKNSILRCNREYREEGFHYRAEVVSSYNNSILEKTILTYEITIDSPDLTLEEIEIPEYTTLSGIESSGLGANVEGNKYTINIDYTLDRNLKSNELLASHNNEFSVQRTTYVDNQYNCTAE